MENKEKIITNIFNTIDTKDLWPDLLKNVAHYCIGSNGGGASLIPLEKNMNAWKYGSNTDSRAEVLYYTYWQSKSPVSEILKNNYDKNLFYMDDSFLKDHEIDHNPFYQDFLREFGVKRIHNLLFRTEQGSPFLLSIQTPWDAQSSQGNRIKNRVTKLAPYINKALSTSFRFYENKNHNIIFSNLFNNISSSILILNSENTVVYKNNNSMTLEEYGISIKNKKIEFLQMTEERKFKNLLNDISYNKDIKFFKIHGPDGKYLMGKIIYIPQESRLLKSFQSDSDKIILFSPSTVNSNTQDKLKDFFLSPSQARISCLIANGYSIKEASEKLNISEGTARQMVKDIFLKLGVNTQSKLTSFVKDINFIA